MEGSGFSNLIEGTARSGNGEGVEGPGRDRGAGLVTGGRVWFLEAAEISILLSSESESSVRSINLCVFWIVFSCTGMMCVWKLNAQLLNMLRVTASKVALCPMQ